MNVRRGGAQVIPRPESWRLGEPPWWSEAPPHAFPDIELATARLTRAGVDRETFSQEFSQEWVATARRSAVLVPIVGFEGAPSLILTKRASHLRNHRGEISFPGGRVEESESIHDAALRETQEEIALPAERVRIISELDPLTTFVSNSVIVPVVGWIDELVPLRPNHDEVDTIMIVPVVDLMTAGTYHNEWWPTPRGDLNIHFFTLESETVWGATARILKRFIDVVFDGPRSVDQGPA